MDGVVTTFAGKAGVAGTANGTGSNARFSGPQSVAIDSFGNVYVAYSYNCTNTLRKVTPAGDVSTLAGRPGECGLARPDGAGSGHYSKTHMVWRWTV